MFVITEFDCVVMINSFEELIVVLIFTTVELLSVFLEDLNYLKLIKI